MSIRDTVLQPRRTSARNVRCVNTSGLAGVVDTGNTCDDVGAEANCVHGSLLQFALELALAVWSCKSTSSESCRALFEAVISLHHHDLCVGAKVLVRQQ